MYRLFNEGRYYHRLLNGEFQAIIENRHPATITSKRIPANADSGEVFYYEGNTLIAVVHCFWNNTGEIVASRKPDPRRMIINGVAYRWRRASDPDKSRLTNREINDILGKKGRARKLTYLWWLTGHWKKFWKLQIRDPIFVPLGLADRR